MSEAVEWARFGLDLFAFLVNAALTVSGILLLAMFVRTFWNFYSEGRHELPAMNVLVRRIYCRHRSLSRVKTRYGFRRTVCSRCGTDVNRNKAQELRR